MKKFEFQRIIAEFVQPLRQGLVEFRSNYLSRLFEVIPFGTIEKAQNASPYGISTWPTKGVRGFFQNLNGDQNAPVIINHLDLKRPAPESEGEVIFYCRKPDGSFPIQIFLKPGGLLKIQVDSKVEVHCESIELGNGGLEKILNGETFQTWANGHKHLDSLGNETTEPIHPSTPDHLSNVVKAKK